MGSNINNLKKIPKQVKPNIYNQEEEEAPHVQTGVFLTKVQTKCIAGLLRGMRRDFNSVQVDEALSWLNQK